MSRVLRAVTIVALVSCVGLSSAHGQTASCPSIQPAPDWVCVDGGDWVPPDHPLAINAQGPPPPSTPPGCPTIQPASDWVCVNGDWLPPDHPLARGAQRPETPLLLLVDRTYLAGVRDSLRRGEPQFQDALMALQAETDRQLTLAPLSVMDKRVTPPSGDKHDYMSQAPYWWPDPSEPDGKPYIRRDGQRNPEIDRITDRQELGRLARAASSLGLAFYLTGREDYAQQTARLVRAWFLDPATRMNPNLNFGQRIPGITDGRSAGIIETRWLLDIIGGVTALQGSSAWTAADDQALKAWMADYLQWLLEDPLGRDESSRGNNHETWYDVQVAALALYTGQTAVAQATLERAKAAIGEQFAPDGRQPRELARTRAWSYSIFNLTAFMNLAALGELAGVDLWNYATADGRSIRKGLDYLVPFATREERFPYKQITPFRRSELNPLLRRAAVSLNAPEYRNLAQEIGGGTARLALTVP